MNALRWRCWAPGVAAVALTLSSWEVLGRTGFFNPALLPAPSVILATLADIVRSESLVQPLLQTLGLMAAGYTIACFCGIALGVAMGRSDAVHRLMEPLIELVRPIPKPALIPPLFLFLGIGLETMLSSSPSRPFFRCSSTPCRVCAASIRCC